MSDFFRGVKEIKKKKKDNNGFNVSLSGFLMKRTYGLIRSNVFKTSCQKYEYLKLRKENLLLDHNTR